LVNHQNFHWALALLLVLGGCKARTDIPVRGEDYDSFWLWAGVKPEALLSGARSLYLLEGEVTGDKPVHFSSRLARAPHVKGSVLWMVVRVETLDWPPEMASEIVARLGRWRAAGSNVAGLQIDFDARTKNLGDYSAFLARLRLQLPQNAKLSITGLLDWSANGDPEGLKQLSKTVDEVVIQTYQGHKTIPGYQAYFAKLKGFPIPFRVGLVQGGEWKEPSGLASHPHFQGYTVFLVNPAGRDMRH
jgi:Protein of unknown function (DUF3142)